MKPQSLPTKLTNHSLRLKEPTHQLTSVFITFLGALRLWVRFGSLSPPSSSDGSVLVSDGAPLDLCATLLSSPEE